MQEDTAKNHELKAEIDKITGFNQNTQDNSGPTMNEPIQPEEPEKKESFYSDFEKDVIDSMSPEEREEIMKMMQI